MKYRLLMLLTLSVSSLLAAASSIDSLNLPSHPENRFSLETVERMDPDALVWFTYYRYYLEEGSQVKHGLWIERVRSRDRERFDTDFEEIRHMYYQGERSAHSVKSIWIAGVLRKRVYRLTEQLTIEVTYNEDGRERMEGAAKARGGRAKRERIVRIFQDVYNLNQ